ncbi:exported hypothetical protein [Gammaproteobacteria bacterium]
MNRRDFISLNLAGGALLMAPPSLVSADGKNPLTGPWAGVLFYTQDAPGRWDKKVAGHLPKVETRAAGEGQMIIKITTDHEMNGSKHYIVKHMLFDRDMKLLGEKLFDPEKDSPLSEWKIGRAHV